MNYAAITCSGLSHRFSIKGGMWAVEQYWTNKFSWSLSTHVPPNKKEVSYGFMLMCLSVESPNCYFIDSRNEWSKMRSLLRPWAAATRLISLTRSPQSLLAEESVEGGRVRLSWFTKIKAWASATSLSWWGWLEYWLDESSRWTKLISTIDKIRQCWQEMVTGGCEGQTSGLTPLWYFTILQNIGGESLGMWRSLC